MNISRGVWRYKPNGSIVAVMAAMAFSIVGGWTMTNWLNSSEYVSRFGLAQWLFGALAVGVGVYLVFLTMAHGLTELLTPRSAILIGFEIFILIGPLLLPEWIPYFYTDPERVYRAWWAVVLGLVSFLIGYSLNISGRSRPRPRADFLYRRPNIRRLFRLGCVLIIARIIYFEYWASLGGGYSLLVAGILAQRGVLPGGMILFWGWWFAVMATFVGVVCLARIILDPGSVAKGYRLVALLLMLLGFYAALVEGNRARYAALVGLFAVMAPIIPQQKQKDIPHNLRRLRVPALIVVAILGVMVQTQFRTRPMDQAISALMTTGLGLSGPALSERGFDMLIYLDRLLEEFGSITPFALGSGYVAPFVLLIPRAVWPNKPAGIGVYLGNAAGTIVGELYANFGWPGIGAGMVLFGMIARRWYESYLAHRDSDLVQMLYAMSLPVFIYQVRGDFNTATAVFLYPALVILGVWRLLSTPRGGNSKTCELTSISL